MNIFLSTDQLLLANMHVGYSLKLFNTELKGFLLGLRQKTFILNTNLSILQLQIISNILINLSSKRHSILMAKEFNYVSIEKCLQKYISNFGKSVVLHEKRWYGGTLTNYKSVQNSSKFNNLSLQKLHLKKRFPSILCISNPDLNKWALFEGYNLGIPVCGLIDSDTINAKLVDYPVIGNNKGLNSILLYFFVLCNSIKKGRQKELQYILQLYNSKENHKRLDNFIWRKYLIRKKKFQFLDKKLKRGLKRLEFIEKGRKL